MKSLSKVLLTLTLVCAAQGAFADATSGTTTTVTPPAQTSSSSWGSLMQKKYNLTDAQVKALADSKLPESEQVKVAQLAKSSGKTIDEVLKMRVDEKMGWGKIAKTLGVHPGELGRAVSDLRKEQNAERKKEKQASQSTTSTDDEHEHDGKGAEHGHGHDSHGKPDHPGHGGKK
jgi:hypothetical protein